ncbi:helix-turn-helix domain-containing protein [Streptomyces uncialis]|uniref:MmyB family transcriptional regulator n=1 Tax=Streptomyces uncialis TaxID=1048205 RepID=UPI0038646B87|nr:helix-turn-helix transcriptional regulator [Streptomyces uncialis]
MSAPPAARRPGSDGESDGPAPPTAAPRITGRALQLGDLVKAWRTTAGDHGQPITQAALAAAVGRSERWVRDLETGAAPVQVGRRLRELADALRLDPAERRTLAALAGRPATASALPDDDGARAKALLDLLVASQSAPAVVYDTSYTVVSYSRAAAALWPGLLEPGANLMRWLLLDRDARTQVHDWHRQASEIGVQQLRYALIHRGSDDPRIPALIDEVCADPDVQSIWNASTRVRKSADGASLRLSLPALGWEPITAVAHVLSPSAAPGHRVLMVNWTGAGTERLRAVTAVTPQLDLVERRRLVQEATARVSVATAHAAADLAGADGVPLPGLARLIGPGCSLTLVPRSGTVLWATQAPDGRWDVSEIAAYPVMIRLPEAAVDPALRNEFTALARASLPPEPDAATRQSRALKEQLKARIEVLDSIERDLRAPVPKTDH